eukprot:11174510-Lingulodinium_polyedra.AAC.1
MVAMPVSPGISPDRPLHGSWVEPEEGLEPTVGAGTGAGEAKAPPTAPTAPPRRSPLPPEGDQPS